MCADSQSELSQKFSSRSRISIWEAAKSLANDKSASTLRFLVGQLRSAPRVTQREAAAYALGILGNSRAIPPLEAALRDRTENSAVRGHSAEALAYLRSNRSIPLLIASLSEKSPIVRFWAAFALGVAGTLDRRKSSAALPALSKLSRDARHVRGFWSVADEATWSIACIEGRESDATKIAQHLETSSWKK